MFYNLHFANSSLSLLGPPFKRQGHHLKSFLEGAGQISFDLVLQSWEAFDTVLFLHTFLKLTEVLINDKFECFYFSKIWQNILACVQFLKFFLIPVMTDAFSKISNSLDGAGEGTTNSASVNTDTSQSVNILIK